MLPPAGSTAFPQKHCLRRDAFQASKFSHGFIFATTGRKCNISMRNTTTLLGLKGFPEEIPQKCFSLRVFRQNTYRLNIYQHSSYGQYTVWFCFVVIALERVLCGNPRNSFIWWKIEDYQSANMKTNFLEKFWIKEHNRTPIYRVRKKLLKRSNKGIAC